MIQTHKNEAAPVPRAPCRIAVVLAVPLLLGACSTVNDWFSSDEAPSRVAQNGAQAEAEAAGFPNLASVPETAPSTTSAQARSEIEESLAADRANAKYSGQISGDNGGGKATGGASTGGANVDAALAQAQADLAAAFAPGASAEPEPAAAAPSAPETAAADTMMTTTQAAATPQFDPAQSFTPGTAPVHSDLAGIIYFANGSAALNGNDRQVLRGIVALNRQRGGTIRVVGHASAHTGTADELKHRLANFEISLKRANAVSAALVALGLPRDRIHAEAHGDSQPIYHEFMPTGEAGNRRAEIFLEN